jgi:hypothetical protein
VVDGLQEPGGDHGGDSAVGREHDIPSRIAGDDFGQHLFIAFVDTVANADAEFALEIRDRFRRDVGGPVVDIESRAAVAGYGCGRGGEEGSTIHGAAPRS